MVSFYQPGTGKPSVLQSVGSQRNGHDLVNEQQQFHRLMSGRIIPTIVGKGQKFPGIGLPPTFWSLMVGLGTVVAPVGVSFSWLVCGCCCYCVTMSIFWGLRSSQRWLVCHLGPVWFWSVYVMSSGYVILSNIVPCPFCFRFTWGWSQLLQEKGGAWEDGHIPGLRQVPEMGHQMWALGFAWERTQEWVLARGQQVYLETYTFHTQNMAHLRKWDQSWEK